jgi:membrane-bound lytic murein transglycosylase A
VALVETGSSKWPRELCGQEATSSDIHATMQDRISLRRAVRGALRGTLLVAAAVTLTVFAGCRTQQEVPEDPNRPTDGPALVKLGPDDPRPDVGAAFNRKSFYLERSVNESVGWFQKPSAQSWFPFRNQGTNEEVCTFDQAAASVVAFRDLLQNSTSAEDFTTKFNEIFDVWQSVGYNQGRDVRFTGYFSPTFRADRSPSERFKYPLYRRPAELVSDPKSGQPLGRRMPDGSTQPWPSRVEIESSGLFKGTELVWLESALDAYIVQVNGSAKLIMPDESVMYVGYAGKTDGKYVGLGQSFMDAGILKKSELSLAAIRRYGKANPDKVQELINRNDSYVFFQEYPAGGWPAGSLGVRVNEDASIATDKTIFPRGGLVMVDTVANTYRGELVDYKNFMLDQDTGGAIRAAGRADLYMGAGAAAELLAGGQYSTGKMYYFFLKPEHVSKYPLPMPVKRAAPAKPAGK